jgi:hypothetical protein
MGDNYFRLSAELFRMRQLLMTVSIVLFLYTEAEIADDKLSLGGASLVLRADILLWSLRVAVAYLLVHFLVTLFLEAATFRGPDGRSISAHVNEATQKLKESSEKLAQQSFAAQANDKHQSYHDLTDLRGEIPARVSNYLDDRGRHKGELEIYDFLHREISTVYDSFASKFQRRSSQMDREIDALRRNTESVLKELEERLSSLRRWPFSVLRSFLHIGVLFDAVVPVALSTGVLILSWFPKHTVSDWLLS